MADSEKRHADAVAAAVAQVPEGMSPDAMATYVISALLAAADVRPPAQAELDHEVVAPEESAVRVLVDALDNLGARIHRDLHTESSYINVADPQLADLFTKFSAYTDECLTALDHPAVRAVLDGGER